MQSEKGGKRKILYVLLAILVAAGIWYYVDENGNNGSYYPCDREIKGVPITYTNVDTVLADRGLMLLEDGTDATVDLKLQGERWLLNELDVSDIRVTVDLSSVTSAGVQRIPNITYSYTKQKFYALSMKEKSISAATVNISELYSKTVDIKCLVIGEVAEGYTAEPLQLSAEKVEIRGQAEDIDSVTCAKVTLDIGAAATEAVSQTLTLQFYDENDQLVDSKGIHPVVDTVQATLPVSVTKEMQLVVNFKEAPGARIKNLTYKIEPSTILVSGDAAQLKNVDTITLGTFDLMDLVNDPRTTGHTYSIIIPEGCKNLSGVTRATMTVSFKDMASAEVAATQFDATNIPAGKTVRILTEELPVSVFGTAADVEAVTGADITVVADLSDYSAASGTYTVPGIVQVGTGGDVGVSGTYQVQVTILEEQTEPETPEE